MEALGVSQGDQQAPQAARRQAAAQHQPQAGPADGHGGRADGHAQQAAALQLLLQGQGAGLVADHQGQDRTGPSRPPPAGLLQPIAPAQRPRLQGRGHGRLFLQQLQGRQGGGGQGRGQGRGIAKGTGALQQPLPNDPIAGQEGAAAAEGLAEGATDQADPLQSVGQAAAARPEHPEGMGLVDDQQGAVGPAHGGNGGKIGTRALHAKEAFGEHQEAPAGILLAQVLQPPLQVGTVAVAKALQGSAAGTHTGQQGVVDQPIGQHNAVAIHQGENRRQVGLEAAGEKQHPLAAQPGCQVFLKGGMHGPATRDQTRSACPHPDGIDGGMGRRPQPGMDTEAKVIVAGQIQQAGRPGWIVGPQQAGAAGTETAQLPPPHGWKAGKGLAQGGEGILFHTVGRQGSVANTSHSAQPARSP